MSRGIDREPPGAPSSSISGPLSSTGWAGLAVLLHVGLALLLWEPTLFEGGDNATYMILGEALRTGEGYRDLHLPGEPLHAKYPPVYPAVLAVLGWFGGLQLFKFASLAFTAGAVALTARMGGRIAGPVAALAAAGLLAVNPVLLEYAHWVLSEAPFLFLVLLALTLLPSEDARAHAAGVAAAAVAFLTRTAGLPLLLAATLIPTLERRWKRAGLAGGASLAAAGGWAVWQRAADPAQPSYLRELVLRNPYDPAAGTVGPADLIARAAGNAWEYVGTVFPGSLSGAPAVPGGVGSGMALLGIAVAALALTGWTLRATQRLGEAEAFALLYAGLIVLWPEVWTDRRFLLPLLPLLLLYGTGAAAATWRRLARLLARDARQPGRGAAGAVCAAVLLGVPGLVDALREGPDRVRCVVRYRAEDPCIPPTLASFFAAARWAREHTHPEAVIANRKPTLFYWVGRRRGDVYRFSSEPTLVLRGLEEMGATHVVVDALSGTTARYLLPAIREYRDRFEVVYGGGDPPTPILRFDPPEETALGPSP